MNSLYETEQQKEGLTRGVRGPIRYEGGRPDAISPPPSLGEHTTEVLRAVGYSDAEIERMREQKIT